MTLPKEDRNYVINLFLILSVELWSSNRAESKLDVANALNLDVVEGYW